MIIKKFLITTLLLTISIYGLAAQVTLTVPEQSAAGAYFNVSWDSISVSQEGFGGYITIVPAGAEAYAHGILSESFLQQRGKKKGQAKLRAPANPGLYEVRYTLLGQILASTSIIITQPKVILYAPSTVTIGEKVPINWSPTIDDQDYIAIAPAGSDKESIQEDKEVYSQLFRHGKGIQHITLSAPMKAGQYEIRYIMHERQHTLVQIPLEVVEGENNPKDQDINSKIPTQAKAGETLTIPSLNSIKSKGQRVSLAKLNQPDFNWVAISSISNNGHFTLILPKEVGRYELRYLDIQTHSIYARTPITIN
ncbi:hypothetical protein [Candidatus Nitrosacidococcus tergens]|uniref:Uncharacterized protein n=1 Tax=Candidatus Nitrosacidococcus tergens TaxID=553981 RepID=A0A7G1Q8Y3_9GAMM|nr:hypothetical protein [Candidatus Nitrosacidococcus tergens]CAB1275521.1 exported protein of unknown function [Candidatus Nitrosacidococcus tergens]